MGLAVDRDQFEESEYRRFAQRLEDSLQALKELLRRPGFGEGPTTLGGELELFIVDQKGGPLPINRALLAQGLDSQVQLELDQFNLEYNLVPVASEGRPFSALERELTGAVNVLNTVASRQGGRVVPIGILPTLRHDDVQAPALSDLPRYRALSAGIRRLRQEPIQVRIDGPDPLDVICDDVTLEGANTSFQVHVRVTPDAFAETYNAAQLATPIALAVGANSPIFLGHRLWDETRVALFKKSVDSRPAVPGPWHLPSRVSFGHGWVRHGAYELFAESVGLHPVLLPVMGAQDPLACLRGGELPDLAELRLHQGTVWRWNRAIYDPALGGHLRIEMRALPAGPTARDMAASAALLVGLALGLRPRVGDILPRLPFEYAHYNFYRAAQHGLDATLLWPVADAPSPREVRATDLLLELLPVAEEGLASAGVDGSEAQSLLNVVRERIKAGMTGARWQREVLGRLEPGLSRQDALAAMLESYMRQSARGGPVTEWSVEP